MTEETETILVEGNPLYHYRASEETNNEAWGTLVSAVYYHHIWDDVKQQFKDWETEYKTTTSLPIPQAWRSAKSVIKGAFNHGIPLVLGGYNEPRGKTAVEKDIKAKKESLKDALLTPGEKASKMAEKLVAWCNQHRIQYEVIVNNDVYS